MISAKTEQIRLFMVFGMYLTGKITIPRVFGDALIGY